MTEPALVVDRRGLAKKLAHKPKAFLIWELLQNALDEEVTIINMSAEMTPGFPECVIKVEDDCSEGFQDLASVYTMFKDSKKAPDPTKRGRFELGEKLVIALAKKMTVTTTKGTICIDGDSRVSTRRKTTKGSIVDLAVKMTRDEYEGVCRQVKMFLAPVGGPEVTFNGETLSPRKMLGIATATLPTIVTDDEGALKTVRRQTEIHIYPVLEGETGYLYEMGIPIVETGDRWHYSIEQRVPMNWERDNVLKSYIRAVRAAALDVMHKELTVEDASSPWVQEVLNRIQPEAVKTVIRHQFGDKAVIADPSDPEGTKLAVARGYAVVHGGTFTAETWANIRVAKALLPAGQVTPSPKAYSDDPNADEEELLDPEDWTPAMNRVADLVRVLGDRLLDTTVEVRMTLTKNNFAAAFGRGGFGGARFAFNYRRLGKAWFERENTDEKLLSLIIHEFGHYYSNDHLSEAYHDALCDLGAKLTRLALKEPGVFAEP